jgi:hypothetical protein
VHPVFNGGGGFVFRLGLFYTSFNSKKRKKEEVCDNILLYDYFYCFMCLRFMES